MNELPQLKWQEPKKGGSPYKHKEFFSKRRFERDQSRRDPSDEGSRMLQEKPGVVNCNSDLFVETSTDQENFLINPPDIVLIDSFGEAFEKAIGYILRQRVVGVAWEGVNVGRFGHLCLVQVGCNKCVYLFDIVVLGRQAFDSGLADIMDSADILKVIHNCRHFSDALYHQYGVSLVNIFDTQVADAIIYRNEVPDRKLPRQTSKLISCMYEYLHLSPDEYHFHKTRLKHTKNDEMVWKNRPIGRDLIDVAAKTVMYLRELRLAQMERMMEEFLHGVDIYLSCVRDAPDDVVKKKSSTGLPERFYELKHRERTRHRQVELEMDNSNEVEEQRLAWEEGHHFMMKYEQYGMRVREHKYPPLAARPGGNSQVTDSHSTTGDPSSDVTTGIDRLHVQSGAPGTQPELRNCMVNDSGSRLSGLDSRRPGIFSQDDFPQLSSDSDSSGQSPRASSGWQHTRPSREPKFGRGRAASLMRNAKLPGARKPKEKAYGTSSSSYADTTYHQDLPYNDKLQFPSDQELLTSSEVVSAPGLYKIPSGPRVRVSHRP
ncbi:piRNA biogenesis protein EXD1-like isoform X2 [Dendronephthya gigantea]|nr:piRNA biogenesis protein EXD1-like isoform X2 [Dendronephthya gigantea]